MAGKPTLSTHDLRSGAVDQKRDRDHKHKWALGGEETTNRRRPARPYRGLDRVVHVEGLQTLRHLADLANTREIASEQYFNHAGDSSADEDVVEPSAAPEPDADITYTFDRAHGPANGSHVLSVAVEKAVERFENVQTERLVKAEYELLDSEGESVARAGRSKVKKAPVTEDDGFELV